MPDYLGKKYIAEQFQIETSNYRIKFLGMGTTSIVIWMDNAGHNYEYYSVPISILVFVSYLFLCKDFKTIRTFILKA